MNRLRYIKSLLVRQGITQTSLAKELGCKPENICGVLSGNFKSRRVMEHIAKRLNRDFDKLWGTSASLSTRKAA